jgi:type I restriction enzyme, S subunit
MVPPASSTYVNDFLFDGQFLLIAEDGANLLSRNTPIAFQASGKFWVNNHAHIVETRGGVPLGYLEYYLNSIDLKFRVTGSAQPKLTQANLNAIIVPLPSIAEQHRIVNEVERRHSVLDQLEQIVHAELRRADRLRQAVLQRAFEGRL